MSEQIKLSMIAYGRRMVMFVCLWRTVREPTQGQERPRGIGRHFAAVGRHLSRAVDQYAERHPEIPAYA